MIRAVCVCFHYIDYRLLFATHSILSNSASIFSNDTACNIARSHLRYMMEISSAFTSRAYFTIVIVPETLTFPTLSV